MTWASSKARVTSELSPPWRTNNRTNKQPRDDRAFQIFQSMAGLGSLANLEFGHLGHASLVSLVFQKTCFLCLLRCKVLTTFTLQGLYYTLLLHCSTVTKWNKKGYVQQQQKGIFFNPIYFTHWKRIGLCPPIVNFSFKLFLMRTRHFVVAVIHECLYLCSEKERLTSQAIPGAV